MVKAGESLGKQTVKFMDGLIEADLNYQFKFPDPLKEE
jgi:hypothetical protein